MKRLCTNIMAILIAASAYASALVPHSWSVGGASFPEFACNPIDYIVLHINGAVSVSETSKVAIMHGNETIAVGHPEADAKVNDHGIVGISFGSTLFPPKGNSYTIVIPPGTFRLKSDPTSTNEELIYDFTVPAVIPKADTSIEENSVVDESDIVSFHFRVETAAVGSPEAILLREGVPVRSYPCVVNWDWDYGQAYVWMKPPMHYENGVGYSWVLPAGSVSAYLRSDIVNEEFRVNFTGGYTKPIKPISHSWCSLSDGHPGSSLGVVKFCYDQPVALLPEPKVQLYTGDKAEMIKDVVPTLAEDDGRWILSADFGDTPILSAASASGYIVVIPEGTLVTATGDVALNQYEAVAVDGHSGIDTVAGTKITVRTSGRQIVIDNAEPGTHVTVSAVDGRAVFDNCLPAGHMTLPVPPGIYVIAAGEIRCKISVP